VFVKKKKKDELERFGRHLQTDFFSLSLWVSHGKRIELGANNHHPAFFSKNEEIDASVFLLKNFFR